jgi:hypothetical protein
VHAELVSKLPVQTRQAMKLPHISTLRTSSDYKAYIQSRTAAWKKNRNTASAASGQSTSAAKKTAPSTQKAKKK